MDIQTEGRRVDIANMGEASGRSYDAGHSQAVSSGNAGRWRGFVIDGVMAITGWRHAALRHAGAAC
jgi:hypothetical protein